MNFGKLLRTTFLGLGIIIAGGNVPARADDAAAKPATPTSKPTLNFVERLKAIVDTLKLTDDQKPKIEAIFAKASTDWKEAEQEADPKAAEKKINAQLRTDVAAALTPEQAQELVKKMKSPPTVREQVEKIKQKLLSLEPKLTDDQIKKVDAILDDAVTKMEEIKAEGKKNGTDTKAEFAAASKEMQTKLREVLSPEQRDALQPKK